ncbi:MAG: hypothetical protein KAH20_00400 [Methylococcales bacterium]|nr:hypothetical protein [Methylococcales bacterium]
MKKLPQPYNFIKENLEKPDNEAGLLKINIGVSIINKVAKPASLLRSLGYSPIKYHFKLLEGCLVVPASCE